MSSIIYQITNQVNSKFYIGKTSKNINERFSKHCQNSKNQNTYLYKAMRKYGIENFSIEVLETTSNASEREIYWIETLSPHYNMTKGGDGGDTSNSPNFIRSMIEMHSKRASSDYATYGMIGKPQSETFIQAIKRSNNCPVVCEGIEYPSVGSAQDVYQGINIRKRLDNPKYPEFYRLRERTLRK